MQFNSCTFNANPKFLQNRSLMSLTSFKEILNAGGMETGMKTNIRNLLLEHLCLPIRHLHVNINNSQVLHLKYFNDLMVKGKAGDKMKALGELPIKFETQCRLASKVKTAMQLPREFASKLDELLSSCLLCMASDFSDFFLMSSVKNHCIFHLPFPISEKLCYSLKRPFFINRF